MAGLGDLAGSLGMGNIFGGGIVNLIILMAIGITVLGSIVGGIYFAYSAKKKWYLKVEVKIPRGLKYIEDGQTIDDPKLQGIINGEWAKGTYDAKQGVVYIKRHKKKPVPMKPFDVKRYLQGSDILSVVQVGIEDYRPILPESYIEMVDEKTGEQAALLIAKIDTSQSKSWRSSFERSNKEAFSLSSLFDQYKDFIGFGILFFMIFVGFAILYGRMR
jgi:hypothetical protein